MPLGVSELIPADDKRRFDPVHGPQRTYRVLLDALSWPGGVFDLPIPDEQCPIGSGRYLSSIALTLIDHEVSYAVPSAELAGLEPYLYQRTAARAATVGTADFILLDVADLAQTLPLAKRGTALYPDEGATLLIVVDALGPGVSPDSGTAMRLAGPGIVPETVARVAGVSPACIEARNRVLAEPPLGVEMLFVTRLGQVMALPRSTDVTSV